MGVQELHQATGVLHLGGLGQGLLHVPLGLEPPAGPLSEALHPVRPVSLEAELEEFGEKVVIPVPTFPLVQGHQEEVGLVHCPGGAPGPWDPV